ncbi:YybH family protein [Anaeromyxobacter terrae]|uniref:YybH family protein n=1 Tax=Anaeromyxobacter terrae TaxID=2925406 RepID=UPI001F59DCA0|nr:nuclear transport factor 2 family protein [Anaeromyxobacter sp. SG22]
MTAILDGFLEAFNAGDLDGVMTYFAEDAVYRPANGVERIGRAAIRREFEPQFNGVLGAMRFDEHDRLIDEKSRKAAVRWVCRHDLTHARPTTVALKFERVIVGALVGDRFGWEGLDVFHFDAAGKIKGKFTYANFARRPRILKELGVALPPPSRRAR